MSASAERRARIQKFSPLSDSIRPLRKSPSASTIDAFKKFSVKHGNGWRVRYSPRTAIPEAVIGGRTARYNGSPEEAAAAFLSDTKDLLNVDISQLRLAHKKEFMGTTHLNYQQLYNGIPVEFSYVRVHVDKDGTVSGYQAKFEPAISLSLIPLVSPDYAVSAALADLGHPMKIKKASLVIFPDEADGVLKLAWKILGRGNGSWVYYVDTSNAKVLFKYDDLRYATNGAVSATVYDISPIPTGNSALDFPPPETSWTPPVLRAISNQYVWVGSYATSVVTDVDGSYTTAQDGKVFASLKGPYFSVTNFRGPSAHFDNGGGEWRSQLTARESPHPYANTQTFSVSLTNDWTAQGYTFAKVMPHFSADPVRPFQVGALDIDGTITSGDELHVKNPALAGNTYVGSYIGNRTTGFYGASVENPSYELELKAADPDPLYPHDPYYGFKVDISTYMVLTRTPTTPDNANGNIFWSTNSVVASSTMTRVTWLDMSLDGNGSSNSLAEANVFYHLNKAHSYFGDINKDPAPPYNPGADLSGRMSVMVHASGAPDADPYLGMQNAYYDFDHDNILLGDGIMDGMDTSGKYRSFALDGTIIRHEYTHKVINQIYPIVNFGEFGAISEAMADYFSIASFKADGITVGGNDLSILGNFLGFGKRNLYTGANPVNYCPYPYPDEGIECVMRMPQNWEGEVHDDSLMLSQALYSLRDGGSRSLGTFADAPFAGLQRSDIFIFNALFYFPDNFINFKDALEMVCLRLEPANCKAGINYWNSISQALDKHGISGPQPGGDPYEPNSGPAYATDAGSMSVISATIYPVADVDYYSIPLNKGTFTANLSLPRADPNDALYSAFTLYLFDADRNYLAEAAPIIYDYDYVGVRNCRTDSPVISLTYDVAQAGRYYLLVAVAPELDNYWNNSCANTVSSSPYKLALDFTPQGSAAAWIENGVFDNDIIKFTVPYASFSSETNLVCSTCAYPASVETVFEYAQLRDHNHLPLALTKTNIPGSYTALVPNSASYNETDSQGRHLITGQVRLQPGFAARYPGVGTVYVEIFGRNRFGRAVSLGVSGAINLSTNESGVIAYNNVINSANAKAIIRYDVQSSGQLSIKVYTQTGTLVKTVYDGSVTAGKGTVDWNGTNDNGGKAASGIYFLKVNGPGINKVDKIAVVR